MRRWWIQAERRRRAFEVRKFEETNKDILEEWVTMRGEDRESTRLRPYLTIGFKMLKKLRKNFDMFDKDGNGTIDAKEFQDMIFELNGEVSSVSARVSRRTIFFGVCTYAALRRPECTLFTGGCYDPRVADCLVLRVVLCCVVLYCVLV